MRAWRATARHVELMDDIHASAALPVVKPKHEMTEREYHPRQAFALVKSVVKSGTNYTTSVTTFRRARRRLLELLGG